MKSILGKKVRQLNDGSEALKLNEMFVITGVLYNYHGIYNNNWYKVRSLVRPENDNLYVRFGEEEILLNKHKLKDLPIGE